MFFSLKYFLVPAIRALAVLQCVAALPALQRSTELFARSEVPDQALLTREFSDLEIRARKRGGLNVQLSPQAHHELNMMGLHGQQRKDTIRRHRNEVKNAMRTNPTLQGKAHTAKINHIAHEGGSDPQEKNHITASFLDKHRNPVPNTFNGGHNHHIYVPHNIYGRGQQQGPGISRLEQE